MRPFCFAAPLFGAVLTLAFGATAVAEPLRVVLDAQQIDSEELVVHSERVGRDFVVDVYSPVALPVAERPVVYVLDGGYGVAGGIGEQLELSGRMPAAFIVTVGYPPGQRGMRSYDLLEHEVVEDGRPVGGGGAAFEAFLLEELRPFIEARYPADSSKTFLVGHSEAGLFTAELLADRPNAYAGYVIASPSVWEDPLVVESVRASAKRGRGRRVYFAVGGAETPRMLAGEAQLVRVLSGRGSSFVVQNQVFAGQTHRTYYPAMIAAALPWLLPR